MSLSFDIAEVAQAVPQSLQRWPGLVRENTDFPKAAGRLRTGNARPRNDRAADKFNKLTPPELTKLHLIIPAMMAVGAAYRIAADQSAGRAGGHTAAAPPSAASNSRRPMVTVMRPSRARCVDGTIARHRRAGPNSAAPGANEAHAGHRLQWSAVRLTGSGLISGDLSSAALLHRPVAPVDHLAALAVVLAERDAAHEPRAVGVADDRHAG